MQRGRVRLLAAGLACLALTACSGVKMKRGEKVRNRRERHDDAGILSGDEGEFVLYRLYDEKKPETSKEGAKTDEGAQKEGQAQE